MNETDIKHIDHIALTVSDPQKSVIWYQEVLGMEQCFMHGLEGPPFLLRAGQTYLNLFPADTDKPGKTPNHDTIAMRHFAFKITPEQYELIKEMLEGKGLAPELFDYGPFCRSIFIKDPDGHVIELIAYNPEDVFISQ
ncbi:hypothetical protein FRE64_02595 [Euhalothece natronophila Z-M001]|uniref:VOC domain-containing protein n=1 Tax=Euhalothece natronophila Z-M001 TaxID=522448 RepID=A0A5B8NKT4_9CHRO|nr:VOC family protein [Euhalothece natronophila]QDZ38925.1 hypothetical protein FRE64_02595 [Euhalothece natronophila Z-M001]